MGVLLVDNILFIEYISCDIHIYNIVYIRCIRSMITTKSGKVMCFVVNVNLKNDIYVNVLCQKTFMSKSPVFN